MKPMSTLKKPLSSVDIRTKRPVKAAVERSDTCAVPAAAVIGEAVSSIEIANSFIEKFGGDSISEMKRNYDGYLSQIKNDFCEALAVSVSPVSGISSKQAMSLRLSRVNSPFNISPSSLSLCALFVANTS